MNWYDITLTVIALIGTVIGLLSVHKAIYIVVGLFKTRKFAPAKNYHRYGILIAARNEEAVIGNLLDSINNQDYIGEKPTVFVVADNCTDNTAKIARKKGAVCYERTDTKNRTKGFALQFLVEQIAKDYGTQSFEGYFVFDADNLLARDYITRMNEAFDAGEKIITSYRSSKNFDDNWISASYALHWLKSCRINHRPRSFFGLATNLQGTGFLFASELVKDGWKYTSFTEDRAFSADAVVMGYKISYNEAAKFYDEQPTSLKIALRQRLRWAKGHLMAFFESGSGLFKGIFKMRSFACYDMLLLVTPLQLIRLLRRWAVYIAGLFYYSINIGIPIEKTVFKILNLTFTPNTVLGALAVLTFFLICDFAWHYFSTMVLGIYIFIIEHKNIIKLPWYKIIWFIFMWPWFDIIGEYSLLFASFLKVEWKPIPHTRSIKIGQISNEK